MRKEKNDWVVDIGDNAMKILRGSKNREGLIEINEFYLEKKLKKKRLFDKNPEVMTRIAECFESYHRRDRVTLLLKDPELIIESFEMQPVSPIRLEEVVYWKVQTAVTGKRADWHYDFIAKERSEVFKQLGVQEELLDIVTVLAEKQLLMKCQAAFKKCGIRINRILPQFLGFGKLLQKSLVSNGMVLDLGYASSCLYQYRNGMLQHKVDMIPDQEEDLEDYLALMLRTVENRIQLFQDKRVREKTKLYLTGGGNLVSGIQELFMNSDKWEAQSVGELLAETISYPGKMAQEELYLFSTAMSGFAGG